MNEIGGQMRIRKEDCTFIRELDAQKQVGKSVFDGGLLLSERAAAERAAATTWRLSDREKEIQKALG